MHYYTYGLHILHVCRRLHYHVPFHDYMQLICSTHIYIYVQYIYMYNILYYKSSVLYHAIYVGDCFHEVMSQIMGNITCYLDITYPKCISQPYI